MTKPTITKRLAITAGAATLALATLGYVGATQLASAPKPVAKTYTAHHQASPTHHVATPAKKTSTTHKTVAVTSKKTSTSTSPSSTKLTAATFMGRWNDLTKGPSLVTTGSIVLSWNGSGSTATPGPTEPITMKIDSPNEWQWNIPKVTFPGGSNYGESGVVTPSGATLINTTVGESSRFRTDDIAVVSGIPLLRYKQLQTGYPFLSISSPTVISTNSTGWKVKFSVLAPYCYTYHASSGGGQCSYAPTADVLIPQLHGSQTLPSTVTLSVTPSASGGLSIALPPTSSNDMLPSGTINVVEPPNADGTSGSGSAS